MMSFCDLFMNDPRIMKILMGIITALHNTCQSYWQKFTPTVLWSIVCLWVRYMLCQCE